VVGLGADRTAARLPRRERAVIAATLGAVATLSWLYLYLQMQPMADMADMAPAMFAPWTAADIALNLAIWWVMMPAMMLPSAAPMILTFATVNRRKHEHGQPFVPTMVFTAGYLIAWALFGIFATFADWALERAALISPMTGRLTPMLGAIVVVVAGIYQLSPLKSVCLRHCRSPFDFVLNHWRDGASGALRMGAEHGLYCLGCCWFLMALMFAAGIMSLLWMAVIAVFILLEKLLPAGTWLARAGGVAMLGIGVYLLVAG
jgi:predicted metal-binding membrane protein